MSTTSSSAFWSFSSKTDAQDRQSSDITASVSLFLTVRVSQIPPQGALHRHRHPPRRRRPGSFLPDRPRHDCVLPQIWELLLPWDRWGEFRKVMKEEWNKWSIFSAKRTPAFNKGCYDCFISGPVNVEILCVFSAGDMYEVGAESGRYYCLNVPLRDGIDDQSELTSTEI